MGLEDDFSNHADAPTPTAVNRFEFRTDRKPGMQCCVCGWRTDEAFRVRFLAREPVECPYCAEQRSQGLPPAKNPLVGRGVQLMRGPRSREEDNELFWLLRRAGVL
jgi:hypothetical protein